MKGIDDYGLPGGHIEEGEDIDDAIRCELEEECGTAINDLRKVDFFFHSNGKLVLAYIGTSESDDLISMQHNLEGIPKWIAREELENMIKL